MIEITIPEWLVWVIVAWMIIDIIFTAIHIFMKWQIKKMKKDMAKLREWIDKNKVMLETRN